MGYLTSVSIILFIFGVFLIAVLSILRQKDVGSTCFFLFSIAVTIWGVGFVVHVTRDSGDGIALWAARISHAAAVYVSALWFHFILLFIRREQLYVFFLKISYVISFLLFVSVFTDWFIAGFHKMPAVFGLKYFLHPGRFIMCLPLVLLFRYAWDFIFCSPPTARRRASKRNS